MNNQPRVFTRNRLRIAAALTGLSLVAFSGFELNQSRLSAQDDTAFDQIDNDYEGRATIMDLGKVPIANSVEQAPMHEPIKSAKPTNVKIDALGIDMKIDTIDIPIEDGAAIYEPASFTQLYNAKIDYYEHADDEEPEFEVGKVGIDEFGKIPKKKKTIIYGHSNSSGPGVLDNIRDIKKGSELIKETKNGVFTYKASKVVTSEKNLDFDTPELEQSLPNGELLLVGCMLNKNQDAQTGKRLIIIYKLVKAEPKYK